MKNPKLLWVLAVLITLGSAYWQRVSGPTYPLKGHTTIGGQELSYRLTRSHGGTTDQPVRLVAPGVVQGDLVWRRYPTSDPWTVTPMARSGDSLVGALPNQPPAGKLEYQVRLRDGTGEVQLPPRPAITRFKGEVSALVLAPHILAMFVSMLYSTRAGLAALAGADSRRFVWWTCATLLVGGFVFGPAVQKQAFGEWWAGVPYGWDLTDNKTLLAGIAWAWALFSMRGGRAARGAIVAAAVTTLVVFAIPHSTWGSEIRWQ